MFPVPVGPTNAAAQQFGAFRQAQDRRREEEDPDAIAAEEQQREAALAHENDIEDEIDAVEQYESTLSQGSTRGWDFLQRSTSARTTEGYPSLKGAFAQLEVPVQGQPAAVAAPVAPVTTDAVDDGAGRPSDSATTFHHGNSELGYADAGSPTMQKVMTGAETIEMATPRPNTGDAVSQRRDSAPTGREQAAAAAFQRNRQGSQSTINEETLHLNAISDEQIRRALDPVNENFSVKDLIDWPEEKLMKLVDYVQPQHLPVLMNRRLQVHEKESAKNFSFHHLEYVKNGETVLHDVSGYMTAGMMVGVLGAPDAGITPLFNILTGRHNGGTLTGDILYDGHKRTADFKRWVGYVVKEDPHLAHMTVFETLYFSARLRLPDMPPKIVRMRVAITLKLLGLSHVANSVVGDGSLRGISGGEKRRVSFGIEMVAGHACIIADLPTNGLDSASAYSLMRTMRFATKIGFSMMASVVQPSPQLLRLFHRIMVMSKGTVIYFGPVSQAEDFFRSAGFIRPQGKALPQFLEEVTLKPELFYKPKRYKEISSHPSNEISQAQSVAVSSVDKKDAEERKEALNAPTSDGRPVNVDSTGVNPANVSILIHDDSGNPVGAPASPAGRPLSPNSIPAGASTSAPTGTDSYASGGGALKWGDQVLPPGINRSRYEAFFIIYNHYKQSVYYQDVQAVLTEQEAKKEQFKVGKTGSLFSRSKSPDANNAPSPTTAPGEPTMDPDYVPRGWGPLGRYWYRHYNSSPWLQLWMNLQRQSVLSVRNTGLWRDTWLTSIVMGFFLGSLFYSAGESYQDVRNRVGLFFFILSYLAFNAVMLVPVLAHQRDVYYNQIAGGYYHGFPYYIGHFITQIPIVVVETFLLLVPVWGLAGLQGPTCGREFWYAYLVIGFNSLISRVWMILLASVSPNEVYADVLNTVTNIIFTKLCGYFVSARWIVRGWYWVYVISYFTYALRGLAKNDIWPITIDGCCPGGGTDCTYEESLSMSTPGHECDFANGRQALYYIYDIDPTVDKWDDFVNLVWFLITFNFGAMLASTYVNWSTLDEPEHPDFGNAMEKKHRELHSDIMKSSSRKIPPISAGTSKTPYKPTADTRFTATKAHSLSPNLALPVSSGGGVPVGDGEDEANLAANDMTYNHRVQSIDLSQKAVNPLKTKKAYLEFMDLDYEVMVGKQGGGTEPRMLLKKTFGYAKPGLMTALMGASGAGKSTLLDVLAGKKTGGKINGYIKVNGQPVDYGGSFSRIAGYVEQFDSHNAFSTVREAVKFSGRLRLPRNTTEDELNQKVDHVLEVLGISHLGDRMIGSPGFGGVSMEVRKKCTIAVELIMEPSLLFLDEPTTGLDSAGAYAVLTSMQLLAQGQGMTVVCTIHQPSAELAMMFDNIILMMPGGRVAYFGPFHDLPAWFAEHHVGELQPGQNPADFALDAVKRAQQGKNTLGQDFELSEEYRDSTEACAVRAEIEHGLMPEEERAAYKPPVLAESQPTLLNQFIVLNNRFFWSNIRNHSYLAIRMFLAVFMGFVVGTVFLRLGFGQNYADQRISAIFVTLVFVMFTANAYLPDIFFLRPIYFRETGSKMYSPFAFYMGRFVADIPLVVVEILALCLMVYFICGLNDVDDSRAFGLFFLTMLGVRWTSIFFTWAIGTAVELPTNANTLQSTYFNLQMILTGFIIPGPYINIAWVWLYDLTYCHWALSFLVANETRTENYTCDPSEMIPVPYFEGTEQYDFGHCSYPQTNIGNPITGASSPYLWKCRYQCGYDLMDVYGVEWTDGWMASYEVILWCFGIFFAIVAAFALAYINHIKR